MTRASFSNVAFAQLVRRLRHTNARYDRIAHQVRCRIRRTFHAKQRACWAGLRIDTSKARGCPAKYVSTIPPPVLDRSASIPSGHWTGTHVHATAAGLVAGVGLRLEPEPRREGGTSFPPGASQGDAYMRGIPLRGLPEVVVRRQRRDGRQRVVLRLPPFKLQLNVNYPFVAGTPAAQFQGPAPGAPRLLPRQLPDDDECGVEAMMLESPSSTDGSESDPSLTQVDVRLYSGLCITVPPRILKRKLQDAETDEDATLPKQPKRILKARWDESQKC